MNPVVNPEGIIEAMHLISNGTDTRLESYEESKYYGDLWGKLRLYSNVNHSVFGPSNRVDKDQLYQAAKKLSASLAFSSMSEGIEYWENVIGRLRTYADSKLLPTLNQAIEEIGTEIDPEEEIPF